MRTQGPNECGMRTQGQPVRAQGSPSTSTGAGLKNAGIRLTKADQKELMAVLDSDGDGTIDYNEFVQMASQDEDQQRKVREVQRKCVRRVPPFAGRGR